jgi:hypothetical protein
MQATEELRQQMQDNNVEFDDIVMTIGKPSSLLFVL